MNYTLTANSGIVPFDATVDVNKVAISNLKTFEVIVCWSYGTYSNLQNLCNELTSHSVINALGYCLSEFEVIIEGAKEL
jgi:hypothetical protein